MTLAMLFYLLDAILDTVQDNIIFKKNINPRQTFQ